MLFKISTLILCCFFHISASAKKSTLNETISVRIQASGDLQGEYELSGPLGEVIPGRSEGAEKPCQISSLFRKVVYRNQQSIEVWLSLDCTFEGQKSTYKPHRFYLQVKQVQQKIKLPMLAKNLKNVQFEFRELSLKSSK